MAITIYRCENPNEIVPLNLTQNDAWFNFSQFCIVYKYEYLYNREKQRFGVKTPYALPGEGKRIRAYNGFDRDPLTHTPENEIRFSYADITNYCKAISEHEQLEIIYVNIIDSENRKPEEMSFLGYDVCYTPNSDGFSAICDCMFLCRWHGCDEKGTEFLRDFEKLNENGLFKTSNDAIQYLYYYLSWDWAETGDFCILEIFR